MSMAMPPSGAAAMSTAGAPAMSRPHQRVGQVAERPAVATPGNELQDKVPQDKKRIPDWRDAASFARDVWPHALRVAKRLNVAPVAIMAQAALETGWGKHVVSGRDGTFSNNLFGIKASHGWQGDSVARRTIEYADGIAHQEVAKFRAYDDVAASFDDYFEFLSTNPRYSKVVDSGGGVEGFASAIAASGYATDPAYAEKISRVANSDTMNRVLAPLKNSATVSIND
jgi:flagellar protein FlgJ